MRGLLAEFGVVAPRGPAVFKQRWLQLRLTHAEAVPPLAWQTLDT